MNYTLPKLQKQVCVGGGEHTWWRWWGSVFKTITQVWGYVASPSSATPTAGARPDVITALQAQTSELTHTERLG
ncbi:hypothetical protein E2C01_089744 [Portunus trituberculatus]|uniref:Uncharacterized protein n=1 Tax=Portunus trituberculatus TaxID=210409 RepID=A0A5B7JCV2_PORTR|nr:hypothetical protein [Portunus trituberculatus]